MKESTFRASLKASGYVTEDGELKIHLGNIQISVWVDDDTDTYLLTIYDHESETESRASYKSLRGLYNAMVKRNIA